MANGANVIRDLFVRLGVQVSPKAKNDTARFNKGIEASKRVLEDTADAAVRAGTAVVGFLSAALVGATALAVSSGKSAIEIERQARALQLTRQEYQELLAVFERFDSDADDLADALATLTDRAQDAQEGTQSFIDDFALVGISVDQLRGKKPAELFDLFANAIQGAEGTQAALAATVRILGDDVGRKLAPALLDGAAGIRAMKQEARDLGQVLTDEQLAAQKEVGEQWRIGTALVKGLRNEIGAELAPTIAGLLKSWTEWIRLNRELVSQRIEDGFRLVRAAILAANQAAQLVGGWDVVFLNVATGAGMLLLLANLGKVKTFLVGLRVAITILGTAFGAVMTFMGISALPLALILAGFLTAIVLLGLAVQDFWVFWQGGESLLGRNLDAIEKFIPAFKELRELLTAVGRGALTSFRNIGKFATAIVTGLAPALRLLEPPLDFLVRKLAQAAVAWGNLNKLVGGNISALTSSLNSNINVGAGSGGGAAAGVESAVSGIVGGVVDRILASGAGAGGGGSVSNAVVNQTNNFASAGSEALERFDSALRVGGQSVSGGAR